MPKSKGKQLQKKTDRRQAEKLGRQAARAIKRIDRRGGKGS
jgi:hypothetical protein